MTQKLTILFDLDGTIVNTAPDLMSAHNHVMRKFGHSEKKLEDIRLEVLHLRNDGHEKGVIHRETMILEKRTELETELEKNLEELNNQIETTKNSFSKLNQELSASISKQLLS